MPSIIALVVMVLFMALVANIFEALPEGAAMGLLIILGVVWMLVLFRASGPKRDK